MEPNTNAYVREITRDDAPELLERLRKAERVHPFPDHADNPLEYLHRRLCSLGNEITHEKRAYGVFAKGEEFPSAVVYVKMMALPTDRHGEVSDRALPGNIRSALYDENEIVENPNTAVFYSISSFTEPSIPKGALGGVTAGQFLIGGVKQKLATEFGIRKFTTLSPARQETSANSGIFTGLGLWLTQQLQQDDVAGKMLTHDEQRFVRSLIEQSTDCPKPLGKGLLWLFEHRDDAALAAHNETLCRLLRDVSMEYFVTLPNIPLVDGGLNRKAMDAVEGFHLGNGAYIGKIHVLPKDKTTEREWQHAFGVMVNYVYDARAEKLTQRQEALREGSISPLSDEATVVRNRDRRIAVGPELIAPYRERQSLLAREQGRGFASRFATPMAQSSVTARG